MLSAYISAPLSPLEKKSFYYFLFRKIGGQLRIVATVIYLARYIIYGINGFAVFTQIDHGIKPVVLRGVFLWRGVGRDTVVGAYLEMLGGGIPLVGKGVHAPDPQ